ncbi:proton-coupled amino acid transporter 4 [Elysia marginata]|uniref:Proton-coupled amino acid transporter 4 n=1 Tax=Elysia marginata TaxID=1093978 RepID=A0AAV4F605_9GAST|nr:proton-coupled amino acid transporter 4 [Elysia marginata]
MITSTTSSETEEKSGALSFQLWRMASANAVNTAHGGDANSSNTAMALGHATQRTKPRWHVLVGDFANMLKAFIGANYLSIAYAFKQSGLVLGLFGLTFIALMTDHCCHLIVKCKYHAIDRILNRKKHGKGFIPVRQEDHDDDSDSDDSDTDELNRGTASEEYKKLQRNFTYGDVGKTAFGKAGLFIVNACLVFTQFGFCVSYFIFVGNTIHSIFPFTKPNATYGLFDLHNSTPSSPNSSLLPFEEPSLNTLMLNAAMERNSSMNDTADEDLSYLFMEADVNDDDPVHVSFEWMNMTKAAVSTGPDLKLLVLSPLPIFMAFAFLRDVRHLSSVSVFADFAIFMGCAVTLAYITIGYETSLDWHEFEWSRLPVFFGMVTSAFEGIGTIIPIESSMEGNRHNYSKFLHGAIFILASVLSVFGVVGYLRYGSETAQMLNGNIPAESITGTTLNVFLCIGVILTFPLQIFPVIEICEIYLFGNGRIFGPPVTEPINDLDGDNSESVEDSDKATLLPKEKAGSTTTPLVTAISPKVKCSMIDETSLIWAKTICGIDQESREGVLSTIPQFFSGDSCQSFHLI